MSLLGGITSTDQGQYSKSAIHNYTCRRGSRLLLQGHNCRPAMRVRRRVKGALYHREYPNVHVQLHLLIDVQVHVGTFTDS